MDAHFRSFAHEVLPVLTREGIAPLGMKCFGDHYPQQQNGEADRMPALLP